MKTQNKQCSVPQRTLSVHKGLAFISFPTSWLESFDMKNSFASKDGEGLIKFPNGRAFAIGVSHDGGEVSSYARELTEEDKKSIEWGEFCPPFETHATATLFGRSSRTLYLS